MDERLVPGRELDALVAEHVMGWGPIDIDCYGNPVGINPDYPNKYKCHLVPNYSSDIAAAWTVVDKVADDTGLRLEVRALLNPASTGYRGFEVSFTGNRFGEPVAGLTAPHAICLAALKAVAP